MRMNRHRAWTAITLSLVLGAMVAVPVITQAANGTNKAQDPGATASVDGGTTAAIDITIRNVSQSGNITAQAVRVYLDADMDAADVISVAKKPTTAAGDITPIATTLTAPSPYIEILNTNIGRNKTYTFTVTAKVACSEYGSVYDWVTDVRQSNDFNGTGNEIPAIVPDPTPARTTVTTPCSLAFSTQPANAASGATITGSAFDPSGTPVTVAVRNGAGGAARWFAGTVSVASTPTSTVSGGSASVTFDGTTGLSTSAVFSSLSIAEVGTYVLRASTASAGVTSPSAASNSFVIGGYGCAVDGVPCTSGLITGSTGNSAIVTVDDADNEITGTLQAELNSTTLDCPGFDYEYGDTLEFSLTSTSNLVDYSKTVDFTKPATYGTASANLWKYQVCFEAPYPFASMVYSTDAQANYELLLNILAGGPMPTATEVSDGVYRGLLPECSLLASTGVDPNLIGKMASSAPGATGYPCVDSRTFVDSNSKIQTVAKVPAADPQMR